jgi:hypothetical protein
MDYINHGITSQCRRPPGPGGFEKLNQTGSFYKFSSSVEALAAPDRVVKIHCIKHILKETKTNEA